MTSPSAPPSSSARMIAGAGDAGRGSSTATAAAHVATSVNSRFRAISTRPIGGVATAAPKQRHGTAIPRRTMYAAAQAKKAMVTAASASPAGYVAGDGSSTNVTASTVTISTPTATTQRSGTTVSSRSQSRNARKP